MRWVLAVVLALCAVGVIAAKAPDRIDVLFVVGGTTAHEYEKSPAVLKETLEKTGEFAVTITKDREQYRAENISRFDVVLVYTTRGDITKEQEEGLVSFVENGGGLVSIHSSTSSFPSSDACWKLFGGRFTKHGRATFRVKNTGKSHCMVRGMPDFEINEETYQHSFCPDSKLICLQRRNTDGAPVSWVQYCGKGRVFATALGHDVKTWSRPEFQELVERGLLWSVGRLNP